MNAFQICKTHKKQYRNTFRQSRESKVRVLIQQFLPLNHPSFRTSSDEIHLLWTSTYYLNHQHLQESVDQSKDLILQKLQITFIQKPNTQSQQVTSKGRGKCLCKQVFLKYKKLYGLQPVNPNDIQNKQVHLKLKECYKNKITNIFDLDETLVHCFEAQQQQAKLYQPFKCYLKKIQGRYKCQNLKLLELLVNDFELIVFYSLSSLLCLESDRISRTKEFLFLIEDGCTPRMLEFWIDLQVNQSQWTLLFTLILDNSTMEYQQFLFMITRRIENRSHSQNHSNECNVGKMQGKIIEIIQNCNPFKIPQAMSSV